jgi:D-alanyl-lipoteichoic acid acyltransferase DltB (MBOAT superfamily)
MLFNSVEFALFLPIVFLLYWLLFSRSAKIQNLFIIAVSYFFYAWLDWRFLILICFTTVCTWFCGHLIGSLKQKYREQTETLDKKVRLITGLNIVINLCILGVFKYYNFFADSFAEAVRLLGSNINVSLLHIVAPVGISFYTFQALTYTIDVYRKKIEPTKDIISLFAFISFFPQLLAGPIGRATSLLPQYSTRRKFDYETTIDGLRLILWGLFKKIVIADRLAILVDSVFSNPESADGIQFIIASVFFSIQIYCDFSGYSDIAIGVAKLFGINLMMNFNLPYLSKSVTEFWGRWHISLSTWFKDYLYIPLGGNRVGKLRNIFNIFIVFVISGLWHGANYTFIIWGAIHGLVLVVEKLIYKKYKLKTVKQSFSIANVFKTILTFFIVTVAWIFFKANNLTDAVHIAANFFSFKLSNLSAFYENGASERLFGMITFDFYLSWLFIFILFIIEIKSAGRLSIQYNIGTVISEVKSCPLIMRWSLYILFTITILWFGKFGLNQFVYLQF